MNPETSVLIGLKRLFYILLPCFILTSCQGESGSKRKATTTYRYATLIPDDKEYGVCERVVVDASVYAGLMQMLGVGDHCIDFSYTMKPDVEKIAHSNPDLLMFSAYEGADYSKYERLGLPVLKCRDFLEPTALGRAEWMRYLGRIWGVPERADSLFNVVEKEYAALMHSSLPQGGDVRRTGGGLFLFDLLYGNTWYQPSPESTLGQIVADAGGEIPFNAEQHGGSLALSAEQVLVEAEQADFWLIRYAGAEPLTLDALAKMNPVYSRFKAFKTGNIFVCYTDKTPYYEETPFRPDWLLGEVKKIINGNIDKLRYFQPLPPTPFPLREEE